MPAPIVKPILTQAAEVTALLKKMHGKYARVAISIGIDNYKEWVKDGNFGVLAEENKDANG